MCAKKNKIKRKKPFADINSVTEKFYGVSRLSMRYMFMMHIFVIHVSMIHVYMIHACFQEAHTYDDDVHIYYSSVYDECMYDAYGSMSMMRVSTIYDACLIC